MTAPTPPGWYLDDYAQMRWWDGNTWTAHVQQMPIASFPPVDPRNARPALTTVAAILAFGGVLSTGVAAAVNGISLAVVGAAPASRRRLLPSWFMAYETFTVVFCLAVAVLLLLGGLALLKRRRSGPVLTAIGCVSFVVFRLVDAAVVLPAATAGNHVNNTALTAGTGIGLALLVFPLVTLCLACGPRTHRWIARTA
ncbi:DUF2510 domain-containing protein [Smaragdicoccus niigatensis]|uniref:DUF2510 domain-containing protein n=1 Tax=Smaragdicoccus niigatensis TaxID=359359 RepID=UPI0007675410|nr:DUF2510 domain-containing protein [Smaragdicoccus niigatensis]